MTEFGLNNIDIVQKRWEEVEVSHDLEPPYDVVIASFSWACPTSGMLSRR